MGILDIVISAGEAVIDLFFNDSKLVDINLTDAELCETASFDSLASATVREYSGDPNTPVGKQVF